MKRNETAAVLVGYVVLLIAALIPLLAVHHPPLQDYPNHLARMFILSHPGDAELNAFWRVNWKPIPNLAMDLVVPRLAAFMPLATAGKLFVALIFVLMTSGVAAVQWALTRRLSALMLLSFLFLPNLALQKGFVNYLFTCGLAFWAFAGWVLIARAKATLRAGYVLLVSVPLFFSHLHGVAIFAMTIAAFELGGCDVGTHQGRIEAAKRVAVAIAGVIPLAITYLLFSPKAATQVWAYSHWTGKILVARYLIPTLAPSYDVLLSAVLVLGVGWSLAGGIIRISRPMAFVLGSLLVAYVLLPFSGLGGANIDWRTLIPLAFLAVASMELKYSGEAANGRAISICLIVALICILRFAGVQTQWLAADRTYVDFRTVTRSLPENATLFTAIRNMSYQEASLSRAVQHMPAYAVAERHAFVPSLFAEPSQQPISYRAPALEKWVRLETADTYYGSKAVSCDIVQSFDYALIIDNHEVETPPCDSVPVARAGDMHLYRVKR